MVAGDKQQLNDLIEGLLQASLASLDTHAVFEISSNISALGRLGYGSSQQYLQAVLPVCSKNMQQPGFELKALAMTAWGLAKLGAPVDEPHVEQALQQIMQTSRRCIMELNAIELSNIIWALAKLQYPPDDEWLQVSGEVAVWARGSSRDQHACAAGHPATSSVSDKDSKYFFHAIIQQILMHNLSQNFGVALHT